MTNRSRGNERDIHVAVGDAGPQPRHVSQTAALTAACLQRTATQRFTDCSINSSLPATHSHATFHRLQH